MSAHRPIVQFYADGRGIKNDMLSIKLQIYFDKQVFIPLKMKFTSKQWESIQNRKLNQDIRNGLNKDDLITIRGQLDAFMKRANDVIEELIDRNVPYSAMDVKTYFYTYTGKTIARLKLSSLFDEVKNLKIEQGRSKSTIDSFDSAKKSLEEFRPNINITDINVSFLDAYEKHMLTKGKSISTVGVYNRVLRSIFQYSIKKKLISWDIYPYSDESGGYNIPEPRKVKKALTIEELLKLITIRKEVTPNQKKAINYFIFSYLSNGINFKDMALLRYKNIDKKLNQISFFREKTSREKKSPEEIVIQLTPIHYKLIEELKTEVESPDNYVFSILREIDNTDYKISSRVGSVLRTYSKIYKLIAQKYEIRNDISFQFARHTFGSIMKINNVDVQTISESMGHSNLTTTKRYINSLPNIGETQISKVQTELIPIELFD